MATSKWGRYGGPTWESQDRMWQSITAEGWRGEAFPTVTVEEQVLPDFTDRVRAGMDLLDKINPGWQDTLNLTTLDLEDDSRCVLGQSWSLYAEAKGLVETIRDQNDTEFRHYLDEVAPILDGMDEDQIAGARMDFAASIGCALNDADFALINASAWQQAKPDTSKAGDISGRLSKQTWEHLTRTWVTEITKAREEGRWTTASAPDGSVQATPSLSPVTVS